MTKPDAAKLRDCAVAKPHVPHEWVDEGTLMWCAGYPNPYESEADAVADAKLIGHYQDATNVVIQETGKIMPNARLKWLLREACEAKRMGEVEMNLDELRAVLAELEARRALT